MKMTVIASIVAVVVVATFLFKKATEPQSYEDCVLKNIKNASNQTAVYALANSCRQLFPKEQISEAELDKIFGITKE